MITLPIVACLLLIMVCGLSLALFILGIVLLLCNKYLPKRFCESFPYWHLEPKKIGFDGCNQTGICPRCGKKVLCDSNGDWF